VQAPPPALEEQPFPRNPQHPRGFLDAPVDAIERALTIVCSRICTAAGSGWSMRARTSGSAAGMAGIVRREVWISVESCPRQRRLAPHRFMLAASFERGATIAHHDGSG